MKKAIINRVKSGKNKGQYRFTLYAANGQVIATSHPETFHNLGDCHQTLINNFPDFEIVKMF